MRQRQRDGRGFVAVVPHDRVRVVDDDVGGFFKHDALRRTLHQPRRFRLAAFKTPRSVPPCFETRGDAARGGRSHLDVNHVVRVVGNHVDPQPRVDHDDLAGVHVEMLTEGGCRHPRWIALHANTSEFQKPFDFAEGVDAGKKQDEVAVGGDMNVRAHHAVSERHRSRIVGARRRPHGRKTRETFGRRIGGRATDAHAEKPRDAPDHPTHKRLRPRGDSDPRRRDSRLRGGSRRADRSTRRERDRRWASKGRCRCRRPTRAGGDDDASSKRSGCRWSSRDCAPVRAR